MNGHRYDCTAPVPPTARRAKGPQTQSRMSLLRCGIATRPLPANVPPFTNGVRSSSTTPTCGATDMWIQAVAAPGSPTASTPQGATEPPSHEVGSAPAGTGEVHGVPGTVCAAPPKQCPDVPCLSASTCPPRTKASAPPPTSPLSAIPDRIVGVIPASESPMAPLRPPLSVITYTKQAALPLILSMSAWEAETEKGVDGVPGMRLCTWEEANANTHSLLVPIASQSAYSNGCTPGVRSTSLPGDPSDSVALHCTATVACRGVGATPVVRSVSASSEPDTAVTVSPMATDVSTPTGDFALRTPAHALPAGPALSHTHAKESSAAPWPHRVPPTDTPPPFRARVSSEVSQPSELTGFVSQASAAVAPPPPPPLQQPGPVAYLLPAFSAEGCAQGADGTHALPRRAPRSPAHRGSDNLSRGPGNATASTSVCALSQEAWQLMCAPGSEDAALQLLAPQAASAPAQRRPSMLFGLSTGALEGGDRASPNAASLCLLRRHRTAPRISSVWTRAAADSPFDQPPPLSPPHPTRTNRILPDGRIISGSALLSRHLAEFSLRRRAAQPPSSNESYRPLGLCHVATNCPPSQPEASVARSEACIPGPILSGATQSTVENDSSTSMLSSMGNRQCASGAKNELSVALLSHSPETDSQSIRKSPQHVTESSLH